MQLNKLLAVVGIFFMATSHADNTVKPEDSPQSTEIIAAKSEDSVKTVVIEDGRSADMATNAVSTQEPVASNKEATSAPEEQSAVIVAQVKDVVPKAQEASLYINGLVGKQPKKLCWLLKKFSLNDGESLFLNRALLYGPPGNGKSITAKVFAKETGSVFVARSACSMVERYVGQGATNVAELFNSAHELVAEGKRVVIFVDEIDSLASANNTEFRTEHKAALQQLWIELDNCKNDPNIFVFFATNEFKKLSKTFLDRCGSNTIEILNPKRTMRKQVLEFYAQKVRLTLKDADVSELVTKTKGLSIRSLEDLIMALRMAKDLDEKETLTKKVMLAELALIHKKFKDNVSEEKDPKDTPLQRAHNYVSIVGTALQSIVTLHTLINIGVRVYQGANLFGLTQMEKGAMERTPGTTYTAVA